MPLVAMPAQGQEHHDESGAHYPDNLLAVFVGRAADERRDRGVALGLEYERRLSERWGIGLIAERTFDDFDANIFALSFAFHNGPWKTYVAPGVEDGEEPLLRLGIEYGFEVAGLEIAPQFDLDFVDGETVPVLGVVIGVGF